MGAFVRVLLVLLAIAAVVIGFGTFALPNKSVKSEVITIDRSAASVFALLASAPPQFAVAEGTTQQILSATPAADGKPATVVADLTYADGKKAKAIYTITPNGTSTQVDVKIEQSLPANPLARIQGLQGAQALALAQTVSGKVTAETAALTTFDFAGLAYDVVQVPARPYLYIESSTNQDPADIRESVAQSVLFINPLLRRYGLSASGPPLAVETAWQNDTYAFRAGIPYEGTAPTVRGLVKAGATPAGQATRVAYKGTEADIITVYDQMEAMIASARLTRGISFEVYLDDLTQTGGSADREIYYMIEGDTSLLTRLFPTVQGRAQVGAAGVALEINDPNAPADGAIVIDPATGPPVPQAGTIVGNAPVVTPGVTPTTPAAAPAATAPAPAATAPAAPATAPAPAKTN